MISSALKGLEVRVPAPGEVVAVEAVVKVDVEEAPFSRHRVPGPDAVGAGDDDIAGGAF